MKLSDFVRIYPLRAENISWLFGAGTSVAAGLPSAYDLIWDFKRRLYCSEQGYNLSLYGNLSDPLIRRQIQNYFDAKGIFPQEDSPEEYSKYFEATYTSPRSRREYIEQLLSGSQLTYGHKVIGTLLKHGCIKLIFTTNFDKAFEDIAIKELKDSSSWFCATLDNSETGLQRFQANKFPLIVKLHGDFQSDELKNTGDELKIQDSQLRQILTLSSYTKGLGIMGYSGRDESIMQALHSALEQPNSFPHGLFWFNRAGSEPLPAVQNLIYSARQKNIEAEIIDIETFDTAWGDIIKSFDRIPAADISNLNQNYFRIANRPLPGKGRRLPLIRFNAVKIEKFPATARCFKSNGIGNTKEIKEAARMNNANLLAIRKKDGIVGFGDDTEFKKAFSHFGNYELDLYSISEKSLLYDDSTVKELLTDALCMALANNQPLIHRKRRTRNIIIPDPRKLDDPIFQPLINELRNINGKIPGTSIDWIACIDLSIQYKLNSGFLVITPGILAAKADPNTRPLIAPFIKEATARWYNDKFNRLLDVWLTILFGNNQTLSVQTFDIKEGGVNASFTLNKQTLHSKLL